MADRPLSEPLPPEQERRLARARIARHALILVVTALAAVSVFVSVAAGFWPGWVAGCVLVGAAEITARRTR